MPLPIMISSIASTGCRKSLRYSGGVTISFRPSTRTALPIFLMYDAACSGVKLSPSFFSASATSRTVSFWKRKGVTIVLPKAVS